MGTTLEILAPYLPYGIEINYTNWHEAQGKLVGLAIGQEDGVLLDFSDGKRGVVALDYKHSLPLLRSFADLCTQLPDGTVPAVQVAKILLACKQPHGRTVDIPSQAACFRSGNAQTCFFLVNREHNNVGSGFIIIDEQWDIAVNDAPWDLRFGNTAAAYDYLRRQHFALPVNGRSLVEGVDYIRKS